MNKFLAILALAMAGCIGSASISAGDGGIEDDGGLGGSEDSGEENSLSTIAALGSGGQAISGGDGDGDGTAGMEAAGDGDGVDGLVYAGGYDACDADLDDCPLEGAICVGASQSPFDPDSDGLVTNSCRTPDCWSEIDGADLSVCPTPPPGGNAEVVCHRNWCAISCAGGLICPDGMVCHKNILGEQCYFPESITLPD